MSPTSDLRNHFFGNWMKINPSLQMKKSESGKRKSEIIRQIETHIDVSISLFIYKEKWRTVKQNHCFYQETIWDAYTVVHEL